MIVHLWGLSSGEAGRWGDGETGECSVAFACEVLAGESAHLRLDLCQVKTEYPGLHRARSTKGLHTCVLPSLSIPW